MIRLLLQLDTVPHAQATSSLLLAQCHSIRLQAELCAGAIPTVCCISGLNSGTFWLDRHHLEQLTEQPRVSNALISTDCTCIPCMRPGKQGQML